MHIIMKLKRKGEEREVNGGVRLISLFNFDFWLQGGRKEGGREGGRGRVGDPWSWALWGLVQPSNFKRDGR